MWRTSSSRDRGKGFQPPVIMWPSSTHRSSENDCHNSLKHDASHDDGGCLYSLLPLSKINTILSSSHSHFFFSCIDFRSSYDSARNKIIFILNPLLFRSVGACWRVQWLDRCLWSSQSVALVKLDVKFQEQDENVAYGPGPITNPPAQRTFMKLIVYRFPCGLKLHSRANSLIWKV